MGQKFDLVSSRFLKSDLAQVPTEGYNTDQYSEISIKWFEWLNPSENLSIQHALNVGEHRVPNYNLDGYDPTTHTGYEFQGCLYHGCQVCYPDTKHPLTKQSSKELYTLTKKKEMLVNSKGNNYECIWECQFRKLIQTNRELAQFLSG